MQHSYNQAIRHIGQAKQAEQYQNYTEAIEQYKQGSKLLLQYIEQNPNQNGRKVLQTQVRKILERVELLKQQNTPNAPVLPELDDFEPPIPLVLDAYISDSPNNSTAPSNDQIDWLTKKYEKIEREFQQYKTNTDAQIKELRTMIQTLINGKYK